jgi:palmitoyl-protein thioesterase
MLILQFIETMSIGAPIVLMHGINSNSSSMNYLKNIIETNLPGRFVFNVEVGNGRETSIFTPMFNQVQLFNQQIQSQSKLSGGFHLIGVSQGTLITRGYIELYNNPPVLNYISLVGPQAGQFGTPYINIPELDCILSKIDYITPFQNIIAPGQYWKNPKMLDLYLEKSIYLAVLNNERNFNQTFYNNFVSINNLILVYSTNDKVIHPPISGWFGFYDSQMNIQKFNETDIYQKDLFGLKKLHSDNKIVFYQTEFEHNDHTNEIALQFFIENIIPWLI